MILNFQYKCVVHPDGTREIKKINTWDILKKKQMPSWLKCAEEMHSSAGIIPAGCKAPKFYWSAVYEDEIAYDIYDGF